MTLELQTTSIGSLAAEAIRSPDFQGIVTNIFTNSFYLKTMKSDIIFFTRNTTRSPITVNLATNYSKIHPFQQFTSKAGNIESGDVLIHIKDAKIFHQQSINPHQLNPQFARILEIGSFILEIIDISNSGLDTNTLTHERISNFIQSTILLLRIKSAHDEFCERAPTLIGLGSGFTPSGDDFLGGFLAAYNTFATSLRRPQIVLSFDSLETKTNWISAKLLDCMQMRILDEEVTQLIRSVTCADENQFIFSLEALASRGHTSGIDIVAGVIIALSVIFDVKYGTNLTTKIAEQFSML
ncbi:MAG TPA: DUF2877 domain-containing protein [Candidatus Bathyarchaeia archaeon]|nr:DUF2877 domain-containing protein [Candidatus Bathyarchaeia archaeon]